MKFKELGYKEKMIEVREITMGTLIQTIAQSLIRNQKQDMEVRIVDCYMGEVDSYKGLESLLMADFQMNWKISVYSMECMHDNVSNKDYLKVIMADNLEMMDSE